MTKPTVITLIEMIAVIIFKILLLRGLHWLDYIAATIIDPLWSPLITILKNEVQQFERTEGFFWLNTMFNLKLLFLYFLATHKNEFVFMCSGPLLSLIMTNRHEWLYWLFNHIHIFPRHSKTQFKRIGRSNVHIKIIIWKKLSIQHGYQVERILIPTTLVARK